MRLFSAENLSGYQLCSCLIMHNHLQMQFPMCMNNSGKVIHDLDLEVLRHALDSLNEEEYHIIDCLYLADSPMTERDLAKSMGKSQPYINRLKRKIFDKIRKFF